MKTLTVKLWVWYDSEKDRVVGELSSPIHRKPRSVSFSRQGNPDHIYKVGTVTGITEYRNWDGVLKLADYRQGLVLAVPDLRVIREFVITHSSFLEEDNATFSFQAVLFKDGVVQD